MSGNNTPDSVEEHENEYYVAERAQVESTGHHATPVFQITPIIPRERFDEDKLWEEVYYEWVIEEKPFKGPEMFRAWFHQEAKGILSGEPNLRSQVAVVASRADSVEEPFPEHVNPGHVYTVALYWGEAYIEDGEASYLRAEGSTVDFVERIDEELESIFDGTPHSAYSWTVVPHEAGTPPLDEK